jgi:hypothetical protein
MTKTKCVSEQMNYGVSILIEVLERIYENKFKKPPKFCALEG